MPHRKSKLKMTSFLYVNILWQPQWLLGSHIAFSLPDPQLSSAFLSTCPLSVAYLHTSDQREIYGPTIQSNYDNIVHDIQNEYPPDGQTNCTQFSDALLQELQQMQYHQTQYPLSSVFHVFSSPHPLQTNSQLGTLTGSEETSMAARRVRNPVAGQFCIIPYIMID